MLFLKSLLILCSFSLVFSSCGGGNTDKLAEPAEVIYKTDTPATAETPAGQRPPIINITDTVAIKRFVLVMKDSVSTSERLGDKMDNIYKNILPGIIRENKLSIDGPRMAWYKTSSAPFFFEAGLPVNKKPSKKLPKNVSLKTIPADSAVVAHFHGPYSLTFQAYEAVDEWMKSRNKKRGGLPYEIYVDDPVDSTGQLRDPYRVQTDIVFPHK